MSFWTNKWLPFIYGAEAFLPVTEDIEILNPYRSDQVATLCDKFYKKYYSDNKKRTAIFGINPGRFGAGVTGISFTDPEKLETHCDISNDLEKREELSSKFIYKWINRFGGVQAFYSGFIILSVCPLGFVRSGKNINYYDDKNLQFNAEQLIVEQQELLLNSGALEPVAYSLGKGKNYKYLNKMNKEHGWFEAIHPLPHPRWVMQYRFRHRWEIMDEMIDTLMSN